ncbi:hypothetical protein ACIRP7_13715 [Streptomyces sp. NPDC102270]|uniref:hypothetical protein n=1 Tax=Streptomyces sp. NPDC102270 TaxID=3366150 RepID=UPI003830FBEC
MTKRPKVEGETRVDSEDWPTFFTMVPEWVTFSVLSDRAHRIYSVLAAHLRRDTGTRLTGVITQADLAAVVGLASHPYRVRRYITELEELGAVSVIEEWDAVRKIPITRYVVRFNPPPGFAGHLRVQDWQEERRAARAVRIAERQEKEARRKGKAVGQSVSPISGGHEAPENGGHQPAENGGPSTDEPHPYETSSDGTAPSARSAADVRRTGAGSSARETESGSAATGEASSSSGKGSRKARVPGPRDAQAAAKAAACREVEAGLPAALVALLPYGHIPKRNRKAVLDALDSRTPQQLAHRAARRWLTYRYEVALHDERLRSPVGVALELIAPTPYCPDPSCEDGIEDGHLGGKAECTACVMRRRDRRDARRKGLPVPTGRATRHAPIVECADCQRPLPAGTPEGTVCTRCTAEAAAAFQALTEQWAAEEQERADQRAAEAAALAGQGQQQAAAEDEEQARLLADRLATEAAETVRLRERIPAENRALAGYGSGARYPTAPAADQLLDEARAAIAAAKTARTTAVPF